MSPAAILVRCMISINKTSTGPLYLQIYSQLRQDIASGVLAEGTVPLLAQPAISKARVAVARPVRVRWNACMVNVRVVMPHTIAR